MGDLKNFKPSIALNLRNLTDPRFLVKRSVGFSSPSMK